MARSEIRTRDLKVTSLLLLPVDHLQLLPFNVRIRNASDLLAEHSSEVFKHVARSTVEAVGVVDTELSVWLA